MCIDLFFEKIRRLFCLGSRRGVAHFDSDIPESISNMDPTTCSSSDFCSQFTSGSNFQSSSGFSSHSGPHFPARR